MVSHTDDVSEALHLFPKLSYILTQVAQVPSFLLLKQDLNPGVAQRHDMTDDDDDSQRGRQGRGQIIVAI
jgi:hypothetical protein